MDFSKDMKLQRNEDIISSEIEDETVMMDKDFERYFGLQSTGTEIWRLLENEITLGALCDQLSEKYDVSPQQCLADIQKFIVDMLELDMIVQK